MTGSYVQERAYIPARSGTCVVGHRRTVMPRTASAATMAVPSASEFQASLR